MVPVQLAGTLGREVCLCRSMHTMTAAEFISKAKKKTVTFRQVLFSQIRTNTVDIMMSFSDRQIHTERDRKA